MKPVGFHKDAETEMNEGAAWYESQQFDLGKRFLASIQGAVNLLP